MSEDIEGNGEWLITVRRAGVKPRLLSARPEDSVSGLRERLAELLCLNVDTCRVILAGKVIARHGAATDKSLKEAGVEDGAVITCLGTPQDQSPEEPLLTVRVPNNNFAGREPAPNEEGDGHRAPFASREDEEDASTHSLDEKIHAEQIGRKISGEMGQPAPVDARIWSLWSGAVSEMAHIPFAFVMSLFSSVEYFDPRRHSEVTARREARRIEQRAERDEWLQMHATDRPELSFRALAGWVTSPRGMLISGISTLWVAFLVRLWRGPGQARLWTAPFILTTIILLCFVSTEERRPGDASAYSVFNRGFRELLGQFNAGHVENILRGGL